MHKLKQLSLVFISSLCLKIDSAEREEIGLHITKTPAAYQINAIANRESRALNFPLNNTHAFAVLPTIIEQNREAIETVFFDILAQVNRNEAGCRLGRIAESKGMLNQRFTVRVTNPGGIHSQDPIVVACTLNEAVKNLQ